MKRMLMLMLLLSLLLSGCGEGKQRQETETLPKEVTVSTVEELLAAIAPGAEIHLAPGTYRLHEAADYGCETDSEYYSWENAGDGWELRLKGVQNLILRGSGQGETVLVTQPRYANVLTLQNCYGLTLADLTLGHTEGGECAGGVVNLLGSSEITLQGLGLYGCGTVGVRAELSTKVTLSGCEIYECSFAGIEAMQVEGMTVENCVFRDLGQREYGGGNVFWLSQCADIAVSGCEIRDNNVTYLVAADPYGVCDNIVLADNTFLRNRVDSAVFYTCGGLIFDGNTMENNQFHRWFDGEADTVLDKTGKSWDSDILNWAYNTAPQKQPAGAQTTVYAATVDELLAAIAPDTEIILTEDFYDFSTAADYGAGYSDYYFWMEEFDGPNLIISGVNNLTVRSESGDVKKCTLSAVPRYANVLTFRDCTNITLSGFTAGHTVEPGYCMGGVLDFLHCDTVTVEQCGLYGCGILGVQAQLCTGITVSGCEIYECSYGGIRMYEVQDITIENCTFRDLEGDSLGFTDCRNVTVDGESLPGNYFSGDYYYE